MIGERCSREQLAKVNNCIRCWEKDKILSGPSTEASRIETRSETRNVVSFAGTETPMFSRVFHVAIVISIQRQIKIYKIVLNFYVTCSRTCGRHDMKAKCVLSGNKKFIGFLCYNLRGIYYTLGGWVGYATRRHFPRDEWRTEQSRRDNVSSSFFFFVFFFFRNISDH